MEKFPPCHHFFPHLPSLGIQVLQSNRSFSVAKSLCFHTISLQKLHHININEFDLLCLQFCFYKLFAIRWKSFHPAGTFFHYLPSLGVWVLQSYHSFSVAKSLSFDRILFQKFDYINIDEFVFWHYQFCLKTTQIDVILTICNVRVLLTIFTSIIHEEATIIIASILVVTNCA